MRTLLFALSLLLIAACSKPTSSALGPVTTSGDTTFTGNYINLNYGGNTYTLKALKITSSSYHTVLNGNQYGAWYAVAGSDPLGIYGMEFASLNFVWNGTSTGSFPIFKTMVQAFKVNGQSYSDTTGTVNITVIDTAHFEGTYSINLLGAGASIPATGDFKIYY